MNTRDCFQTTGKWQQRTHASLWLVQGVLIDPPQGTGRSSLAGGGTGTIVQQGQLTEALGRSGAADVVAVDDELDVALLDDVEVIAGLALDDDVLPDLDGVLLERLDQGGELGGFQAVKHKVVPERGPDEVGILLGFGNDGGHEIGHHGERGGEHVLEADGGIVRLVTLLVAADAGVGGAVLVGEVANGDGFLARGWFGPGPVARAVVQGHLILPGGRVGVRVEPDSALLGSTGLGLGGRRGGRCRRGGLGR